MLRNDNRSKVYRTLAMLCESESLSDSQLKAYQTRLQEYRTYLEAVSRLANCGNVCITEEAVMIGDNGLLTGESLNALQHAGAISVYNTLQQNNWEFPVPEEGEVAVVKAHTTVPDDFLDSEKPIRSDWPSVFVSECFVEGEKAKLHGSARPLRSFLPPSIVFRSAADIDDDLPEPELPASSALGPESGLEIVSTSDGLAIRKTSDRDSSVECIPIDEYYYGRQEGSSTYVEEKAEFRFKCAVCQRMFYSNVKLMYHIMGHVDEPIQGLLGFPLYQCRICNRALANAFCLRAHLEKDHGGATVVETSKADGPEGSRPQLTATGFSCRICGKEAASDLALAHHLQSTHRQREMPYVCRICLFRSSLYEDLLDHFKKAHSGSNHLLCTYCLRIFTPSDARVPGISLMSPTSGGGSGGVSTAGLGAGVGQTQVYLQHLRMHQVQHQLRRCPACRLNFTNKSDYQVHRRLDHKACSSSAAAAEQQLKEQQMQQEQEMAQEQQAQIQLEEQREQELVEHVDGQVQEAHDVEEFMTDAIEPAVQQQEQQQQETGESEAAKSSLGESAAAEQQQLTISDTAGASADAEAAALAAAAAAAAEEENRVILLNAPEPSRTKDLSTTQLPPEAAQLTCLECGDPLSSDDHKQYLPCSACVFATCCAAGFTRHVHRAHMYPPGTDVGAAAHTGSPMIRPIVTFDWLTRYMPPVEEEAPGTEVSTEEAAAVDPMEVDYPSVAEAEAEVVADVQFACPRCALSGVDGNTLARHLVEECGVEGATLQPDPEIVSARMEAEEQMRLQQEQQQQQQQVAYEAGGVHDSDTGVYALQAAAGDPTSASLHEATTDTAGAPVAIEQQAVTLGTAGNLPATIDITDAGGEVVQRLVLPEDLQLEPGQTLVLIQGEDGQPQLAVINQAEWDASSQQQMVMQTEDDTSNLLLYGNTEADMAEEKENQL
ncbi:suppressor of hairy wing [Echinococcus multilocularis]|uniref:Suppressor of hairy wing n=1 Tax=Echinococcus multilocularis TaxID=6211 RepID=A0A068XWN1_ECHMU|nr:suppressor of hairy wing [Echinococcus multilocularis]